MKPSRSRWREPSRVSRWRQRFNDLSWWAKGPIAGVSAFIGLLFLVKPLLLFAGDQVNIANDYAKQGWVIAQVQVQQQGSNQKVDTLYNAVLYKWWGENRDRIATLEYARSRRPLIPPETDQLSGLYGERDRLTQMFQKAGMQPPQR